jgi:hypothetical protein
MRGNDMRSDDDLRRPAWYAAETQSGMRSSSSGQVRDGGMAPGRGRIALMGLGALIALVALTACCTQALVPLLTGFYSVAMAPSTTISRSAVAAPTASATSASQATATPATPNWRSFTSGGGFRIDLPGALGSSHGYFINDFSGQGFDLSYLGAPIVTPLQQREAQIWVSIRYSTKIVDTNICPQGGVPVTLGSGNATTPAWQRDEGTDGKVNLVLNGTAIEIALYSSESSQPVLSQYADIWRHMLASFAPLPGQPQHMTHPCG